LVLFYCPVQVACCQGLCDGQGITLWRTENHANSIPDTLADAFEGKFSVWKGRRPLGYDFCKRLNIKPFSLSSQKHALFL
jgi:hypothetical protein